MSQLVAELDQLKRELEEMTTPMGQKDDEMSLLKAQCKSSV